ncbi:MAG: NAD-dependent epimerase/dehydratase family protein [Lentisphaeria bacterium]|jgi:nucleoside-diphosphate-sugar epimerase|nr:NAD-dependent epimerase/dehydratase family protein [Lentisphaeria bacterium]
MKQVVSILGCGWLGRATGKHLIRKSRTVRGSTRDTDAIDTLRTAGFEAYVVDLSPGLNDDVNWDFFNADVLISCIPLPCSPDIVRFFELQMMALVKAIRRSPISSVLFVSSTSVYPAKNQIAQEVDVVHPEKDSGKALLIGEQLLHDQTAFNTTVLRCGGLIGYDRHPARRLAERNKPWKDGDAPLNLIHRDDCVEIISRIIEKNMWNRTYNAVADDHPTRKRFYETAAAKAGVPGPDFTGVPAGPYKIVSNDKLKDELDYQFKFPHPLDVIFKEDNS